MRLIALLFAVLLSGCSVVFPAGEECTLTITNGTSDTLWRVWVRTTGTDDWGEDLLGSDTLADGEQLDVGVDGGEEVDVGGEWAGGESFTVESATSCVDGEDLGVIISLSDQD